VPDIPNATRFIAVATHSAEIDQEWAEFGNTWPLLYRDYALLKVLYMLGMKAENRAGIPTDIQKARIPVSAFQWEEQLTPLDFSNLQDTDVIFIAGHGNEKGLYAMGPKAKDGMERLVQILTKDGNLKKKRKDQKTSILLLSCRAGLGFHKELAHELYRELGIEITVGGARGFTFGSMQTFSLGYNDVLIKGIPWRMEYPASITEEDANKETSARENKTITYAGKKTEIEGFLDKKRKLEAQMKDVVSQLQSAEVNQALDELDKKFRTDWLGLIRLQFELYGSAKTRSNLEFNMWYNLVTNGYVWTNRRNTTDQEVDALLAGNLTPTDAGLTSTR
jgi:hypothetical protein